MAYEQSVNRLMKNKVPDLTKLNYIRYVLVVSDINLYIYIKEYIKSILRDYWQKYIMYKHLRTSIKNIN